MPEDYVIAVKRARRDAAPRDWQRYVCAVPGVEQPSTATSPDRIRVRATPAAVGELRRDFGEFLHIEPVTLHYPSSK